MDLGKPIKRVINVYSTTEVFGTNGCNKVMLDVLNYILVWDDTITLNVSHHCAEAVSFDKRMCASTKDSTVIKDS